MTSHAHARILFRDGDRPFSDTISVTPNQEIAVQVGDLTITLPLKEWHRIGRLRHEYYRDRKKHPIWTWFKSLFGCGEEYLP